MTNLSEKQKAILAFLQKYIAKQGYPPSEREIAKGVGIKWVRGVQHHLAALEEKGFIRRGEGARAIELTGPAKDQGIPILGRVAAGRPILAEENRIGTLPLDKSRLPWKGAFLLKVKGDSMKEGGILEGDYVLVRPQSDADSGEIVVAMVEGEATVKRLIKKKGSLILQPENPDFSPIVVTEKSGTFQIVGKVVGLFRLKI